MLRAGFESAISMLERPKTVLALDRAAIETGPVLINDCNYKHTSYCDFIKVNIIRKQNFRTITQRNKFRHILMEPACTFIYNSTYNLLRAPKISLVDKMLLKSSLRFKHEGVSKSSRTGRLEWETQMVQLSATRGSCIAILWVSLVSFAAITLYVASQRVFVVVVVVYFIMTQSGNFWIHPRIKCDLLFSALRIIEYKRRSACYTDRYENCFTQTLWAY
jgi:hypothetical protein